MKELRSFGDVIENLFYDEIEKAICEYVADNIDRLDLHSSRVQHADEVLVADLHFQRVDISDGHGDGIRFDVIVETEMEITETIRRDRETGEASEWFRVSCKGTLNNGLQNF